MISETLLKQILQFRKDRDWEQFHTFRTLSTSIVLEAAELSEITQWAGDHEIAALVKKKKEKIEEEVADIAILLSYLIYDMEIDLDEAVRKKLEVNARKYPVAQSKGTAKKYDELDR